VLDARQAEIWTAIPGVVVSYDAASQTAAIQPAIKNAQLDPDGDPIVEQLPQIPNVPVLFPRAGDFSLTFPVLAGDTVLLVFQSRSADRWRNDGQSDRQPSTYRMHDMSDAVAFVGYYPATFPLTAAQAPTNRLRLGNSSGADTSVNVSATEVKLGDNAATSFVALAAYVDARLQAIYDAVSGAAVLANDGGATLKTNILAALVLAGWPAGVLTTTAATKVKAT
jgi:hypothetical protein